MTDSPEWGLRYREVGDRPDVRDRRPGVLNLDTDHVVSLVGGWQDNFWTALVAARQLAVSMAANPLDSDYWISTKFLNPIAARHFFA